MASTNHTANYSLPQWVATDPVLMTDFNSAFSAVDTQMKANADAAAEAAHVVAGTYTGNGQSVRSFQLGGRPKAVLVVRAGFTMASKVVQDSSTYYYGGLSVDGKNCKAVTITDTGFNVFSNSSEYLSSNINNEWYNYLALM